jgi:superfamily II DNA or RNA helicase
MIPFDARPIGETRAILAAAVLPAPESSVSTIGDVTLHDRQRVAADRLTSLIRVHGGALLADPVGFGKTYTALAVAARIGGSATVIAPAALRSMWMAAIASCRIDGRVYSHESLSRGGAVSVGDGLVIVDEAHGFRSSASKRYATLAARLGGAALLLVSATPVQNRRADLTAQLALFLGRRAWSLSDHELAAFVVRDGEADRPDEHTMPELNGPIPLSLSADDDCLDQLLALPPPVATLDESVAATLLTYGLVHQWSSSRAALAAALRRRRTHGLALLSALDAGRYPTRSELAAWTHLGDAMQLAFPELVVDAASPALERNDLTVAVDRHLAAVDALLARCRADPDPDDERAALLARLMDVHRGERIIAFCHYAETVDALRRRLVACPGVATLTARGARVASGRVSRDMILSQFTPRNGRRDVEPLQRVSLLIATDLLSEGLNLQEASVIVHLDLPWNPARLDQRVGRARRLGSRHRVVTVYSFAPPTSAERMLRIHDRLQTKLRVAQRAVGVAGRILPAALTSVEPRTKTRSFAEESSLVDRRLRDWVGETTPARSTQPAVAIVASPVDGFIAAVGAPSSRRIVVDVGNGITDDIGSVERAITLASGPEMSCSMPIIIATLDRIATFLQSSRGAESIDFVAAASARARRATLARVAQTLARTPRHRRALIAPLADAARSVATASLGEGAERILETLVKAELPDEAWLRSIATFGELNARHARAASAHGAPEIIAVVVLLRTAGPTMR